MDQKDRKLQATPEHKAIFTRALKEEAKEAGYHAKHLRQHQKRHRREARQPRDTCMAHCN